MSIVLLGHRGCGKTTVGKRLADRLWWKFVDLDERIVAAAGKSIRAIFEEDGEPAFRALESARLAEALSLQEHVIALGGGAVVRDENRALLIASPHKRIYLRCAADVLHQRIAADPATAENRPALTPLGGGLDEVRRVLEQREPLYRACMTAELDVTRLSPQDAVVHIARFA